MAIFHVDLYGTAVLLDEFGNVIAYGGAGVVIASQSGHRLRALTAEQDAALATTPADELLALPMLQPGKRQTPLQPSPRRERSTRRVIRMRRATDRCASEKNLFPNCSPADLLCLVVYAS